MRVSRLLVALLALALLGLVPAASSASASQPAPVAAPAVASGEPAPTTPVSARSNKLTAKIVKRGGKLILTGVVRPKKGPIVIEKATDCTRKGVCNFTTFGKSKLNRKGRYSKRVYAPRNGSWAWRAVKGSRTSDVWLTCVKKPTESCPIP